MTATSPKLALAVVSLALLALSACGSAEAEPPPEYEPAEEAETDGDGFRVADVPESDGLDVSDDEVPERVGSESPVREQIEWQLRDQTANVTEDYYADMHASCPSIEGDEEEPVECLSGYKGVEITWTVDVSGGGDTGDASVVSVEPEPDGWPLSRDRTEQQVRYRSKAEAVQCDMGHAEKVQLNTDPDITCKAKEDDGVSDWEIGVGAAGSVDVERVGDALD